MVPHRKWLSVIVGLGLAAGLAQDAKAQSYPSRLVTIVAASPAGGTPDVLARFIADTLRTALGQEFIVENRAGAGGALAAEYVGRAAPDGHVLLSATEWVYFSKLLQARMNFDPQTLEPVSVIAKYPLVLIGRRDLPVRDIGELIAYAGAHPGLTYGSAGNGSMHQLVFEAIKQAARIDLTHVPYRGGTLATNDLLAGHIDLSLTALGNAAPHVKDGKLKLLGIVSDKRLPEFPDAPALGEALPGLGADAWTGIVAPPGTPKDITAKLSAAIAQALQSSDLRARIEAIQAEPVGSTPEEMLAAMRRDVKRWSPVITAAKISAD
jgi:tripartite-type tricarboxylate transporter receptor subunit TctC